VSKEAMIEVTIPTRYGDDWYDRAPSLEEDFDEGDGPGVCEVVKRTARSITFRLNAVAFDDLRGDADYYADTTGFFREYHGLCHSAKRALEILNAIAEGRHG